MAWLLQTSARMMRALALLMLAAIAACDTDNVREDVILCEEAVAHLQTCCGSAAPSYRCDYASIPCFGYCAKNGDHSPDLAAQASRDIMAKSCERVAQDRECVP